MGQLDGRKVLITGASSGIGEATAEAIVAEGGAVALGARRKDKLDELAARLDGDAYAIEADIGNEDEAKALVEGANEAMGGLDGLVNNAGVMLLGPLQGADPEEWRTMINVNCLGLLYCTHYALPADPRRRRGDIVNVSSVAGRTAALGSGVYNMTKWGVVGYSESLRQEGSHIGVRVTCVEPGFVETELQGHNKTRWWSSGWRRCGRSIGKPLEAADIANAIVYALAQPKHVSINEIMVRPSTTH